MRELPDHSPTTVVLFESKRTSGSNMEVVDENNVRVAFLPKRDFHPEVVQRRASIIAAALTQNEITRDTISIRDTGTKFQVWDGPGLLADFEYVPDEQVLEHPTEGSRNVVSMRASAFVDGYLLSRHLCLGDRS